MSAPVAEGDVILDKYRVERVLGQGGMGVVVAAVHVDLEQKVALKFLLPKALEHAELVERFAREAKAAAKIQSRHVARVLDTGRMPSGAPFMVMEHLDGEDLAAVLERSGSLDPNVVADYLLQACEAIGEAHAAGIVHRDLKPSNLFLAKQRDRRSIVKVLDFGISKLEEPDAAPLTRTATALGSPHYMSPEQLISSKDVDARSDIWSLGVIMYELVSGSRPFGGETMPEVVGQVLNNEPERLSSLRAGLSLDFELLVARCLTTKTTERFQTVAELGAALRPFATDAVAAAASVDRIARVLGRATVPPVAPPPAADAAAGAVVIQAPEPADADADADASETVRPLAQRETNEKKEEATKTSGAAAPSAAHSASHPTPEPPEDGRDSGLELAHAATTPSSDLSRAVESARASAERPPSRRGIVVIGVAAVCLAAFAGMRAGMSRPSDAGAERTTGPSEESTPSAAPPTSAPPESATTASHVAIASAIPAPVAQPSAQSSTTAAADPSRSARAPSAAAAGKPVPRPSSSAPAAGSARQPPRRENLEMDIK